ncbi:MAG: hypothetical protein AAGM46_24240 [Cyanobacteria bacterium J06582_2]
MVNKNRRKIAKKPQTQSLPNPDSWVSEGGVDPEIESLTDIVKSDSNKVEKKAVSSTTVEATENKKTYPHRISFDMDAAQYKRLKWASFDSEAPMNSILREAIEEWMKSRNY